MINRLSAVLLTAAVLAAPALPAAESVLLQDVRVIDGSGGPPQEHADILIKGTKIVSISPHAKGPLPANTHAINLAGKTVLPGLISDHSHLGLTNGTTGSGNNVTQANIIRQLKQYAAYGVTSVTSLGLNLKSFYALRPLDHRGKLQAADMFGADKGFGSP